MASRRCAGTPGLCPAPPLPTALALHLSSEDEQTGPGNPGDLSRVTPLKLADSGSAPDPLAHAYSALHQTRGQWALGKGPGRTLGFADHTVSVPTAQLCPATAHSIQTSTGSYGLGRLSSQTQAGRLRAPALHQFRGCAPLGAAFLAACLSVFLLKFVWKKSFCCLLHEKKETLGTFEVCSHFLGCRCPGPLVSAHIEPKPLWRLNPLGQGSPTDSVPPSPEW